ncbi:MAG: HlyD family secretion protein [Stenotrophomonas sp.]|uniref:HlyD family secretion protein n=1 Tax=Stenotrophomonas sp. TaxID=69392 RepID=UPI003D6D2598
MFREEVLHAKRSHWLGPVSLLQPLRWRLLTLAAIAAAGIAVLFISLTSYTRRSTVSGQLVPVQGLITVLAPATGLVSWLDAQEGERVTAGGDLALVSMPRATLREGSTGEAIERRIQQRQDALRASRHAAEAQLQAQFEGLEGQLAMARRELRQIESEVATRQQQRRIAGETLQRLQRVEQGQYVSVLQINQQEASVLEHTGQMQALQRQATATQRLVTQLEQAQRELPGRRLAGDASHQQELAQLEQERVRTKADDALLVKAPVSGVVTSQTVKPGQAVQQGQALLSLLPGDGRLEAELLVPSSAIGFIAPGDRVRLRYEAFPYQKFGHQEGRVSRISRSALSAAELAGKGRQEGEALYRISVVLARQHVTAYGKPEPLKPGMLLVADVMGERRQLIEWIFEPLYTLKGRLDGSE